MEKYYNTLGIKPTNNLEDIELVYKTLKMKYDISNAKTLTIKDEYLTRLREIEKAYKTIYDSLNDNQQLTEDEINTAYRLCKKNILSNILNEKYAKFPSIRYVTIEVISDKIKIEGTFQNKNHIEQIVETDYTLYLDRKFNFLKLDFGNSTIIDSSKVLAGKPKKNYEKKAKNSLKKFVYLVILGLIVFAIIKNTPNQLPSTPLDIPSSSSNSNELTTLNKIKERINVDDPVTQNFYNSLTSNISNEPSIIKITYIHNYLATKWNYLENPNNKTSNKKASEIIQNNLTGNDEDFAILIASSIKSMGERTRIVLGHNNSEEHTYAEVYLSNNKEKALALINELIEFETANFSIDSQNITHYRVDGNGEYWLNLDNSSSFPGGIYYHSITDTMFDIEKNTRFESRTFEENKKN